MAPFPESEDMTIKRLTVAIRKNDYQLLKMGTYKLHEKYHTGYEFELVDELRQILDTIEQKQYPPEISDILCTTIKDILSKKAIKEISHENQILPSNSGTTPVPENIQGSIHNMGLEQNTQSVQEMQQHVHTPVRDLRETQPTEQQSFTLKTPNDIQQLAKMINSNEAIGLESLNLPRVEEIKLTVPQTPVQPVQQPVQQTVPPQTVQVQPAQQPLQQPVHQQIPEPMIQSYSQPAAQNPIQAQTQEPLDDTAVKDIAVFYDDTQTNIDYSEVKGYKNNLNLLFSKNQNGQDYNILKQISSLTHLLDTSVLDIDKIISMLTTSKGKVSFVTASQSQNISKIFCEKNIDFDIPFVKKAKDKASAFDLIPMVGSTNIFVCSNCNLRTLKTDFNTRTLSVQCPHCDSAAFPDIYAVNSYNPDCNPVFWHRAFAALIKSKIWILINPPLDENREVIVDFIKTAYETGLPSKVYILSKENDKKEFYRQMFVSANKDCVIKHNFQDQGRLCEEFINEEIIKKVFA